MPLLADRAGIVVATLPAVTAATVQRVVPRARLLELAARAADPDTRARLIDLAGR